MKLGVIGCGKMGSALVEGIVQSGTCRSEAVCLFDVFEGASKNLAKSTGAGVAETIGEMAAWADAIVIAVKPQVIEEVLEEFKTCRGKLLISIVAGVKISRIENGTGKGHRVIRVMPNTPALIGKGAAAYAKGASVNEDDSSFTRQLLESVGFVCEVDEEELDAVTALSGSGPAYVFFLIESMVAAAVDQGLDGEIAQKLAVATIAGAAEMVEQTGQAPATLRENVTSPNGTTFAALESFRENRFSEIVKEALEAARDRSIELGNQV